MICLDTNYLIRGLVAGSTEAREMASWRARGESLIAAAPAWYEFLCGPVQDDHVAVMRAFLNGGISPFDEDHAREAARLYNQSGRVRRLRVDAMIAAAAVLADARLATGNRSNFEVFAPLGLKFA
jgi:predicted nucleic acid-binding protein